MASHPRNPWSIGMTLTVAWAVANSMPRALYQSVVDSAIYKQYDWHFKRIFGLRLIQLLTPQLGTSAYGHDLLPTTGSGIRDNCQKYRWPLSSHNLPGEGGPDSTLHEIRLTNTSPNAPVLLYLHGGGYRQPASPRAHAQIAHTLGTALNASTVFFLEYTLTPFGKYPTQLRQAAIALRYLLVEARIQPEQIVLSGDSAGGHLVLSLLAHLIKPHPDIRAVTELQGKKLKGGLCISPWVAMTYDTESFAKWGGIDMLSKEAMTGLTQLFVPQKGVWADMLEGDKEFWSRVPVKNILLTAGGIECFHDDIVKMAELLQDAKKNGAAVSLAQCDGEVHVQIALNLALNLPHSRSTVEMIKWLKEISA